MTIKLSDPEHNFGDEKYCEIIPTAILTAYPRTFSDIPYSQEIFDELVRYYGKFDNDLIIERLAVELEARSKIIDKLLAETGTTQVFELAAGFSSRGLVFSQNTGTSYVELDLPDLAKVKQEIIANVAEVPASLHIFGGNALRSSDFDKASEYFEASKEVVVVNEGLLRYLTFDEKAQVAMNVRRILEQFGGIWISGDGGTKQFRKVQDRHVPGVNDTIMSKTKRNDIRNAFENQEHFSKFFDNLGFSVEFHAYTEVQNELSSPEKLGLSDDEISNKLLAHASAIVLRPKG